MQERRTGVKVSVIVAAYNAEKYVTETLESIANQTLDDYEIIVVNDGSTDHTIDILREYESEYDNMTVIDKENGGPSSARNSGLDIAKGDYVYFFDADDVLEIENVVTKPRAAIVKYLKIFLIISPFL